MNRRLFTGVIIAVVGLGLIILGIFAISRIVRQSFAPLPAPTAIPVLTTQVVVTDTLPANTLFASASPAYTRDGNTITWNLGTLGSWQKVNLTLSVYVRLDPDLTSVTNEIYGVRSDHLPLVPGLPVSTLVEQIPIYPFFLPVTNK